MISVVLDTNVIVSAILSDKGSPAKLLQLWKKGMIDLITCEEILHEVNRVMKTPRLTMLHNLREHEVDKLVALLRSGSKCVECSYSNPQLKQGLTVLNPYATVDGSFINLGRGNSMLCPSDEIRRDHQEQT